VKSSAATLLLSGRQGDAFGVVVGKLTKKNRCVRATQSVVIHGPDPCTRALRPVFLCISFLLDMHAYCKHCPSFWNILPCIAVVVVCDSVAMKVWVVLLFTPNLTPDLKRGSWFESEPDCLYLCTSLFEPSIKVDLIATASDIRNPSLLSNTASARLDIPGRYDFFAVNGLS
jgi:hypothetical protein